MNDEKQKPQSCGCGTSFKNDLDNIVSEGTKPTTAEHDKKKMEVNAAFNHNERTPNTKAHHNDSHNVHADTRNNDYGHNDKDMNKKR